MSSIENKLNLFYSDLMSRINTLNEKVDPLLERISKIESTKSGNITSVVSTLHSALNTLESIIEKPPTEVVSSEELVTKKKNILFFPHQGLGDQVVMFAYINYLLKSNDAQYINEICVIGRRNMQASIEQMYSDLPNITFHWLETWGEHWVEQDSLTNRINGLPFNTTINFNNKLYLLHNFGTHSSNANYIVPNSSWADSFYLQVNLPATTRFTHFQMPSNLQRSQMLYENLKERLGGSDYILVHDDPSRGRNVLDFFLKDITKNNKTRYLPVLYLGKNRYDLPLVNEMNNVNVSDLFTTDSIFDYYHILVNAKECHFMDSSFACLTDQIKEGNTTLYMHSYIVESSDPSKPKAHINRNWVYVRKLS